MKKKIYINLKEKRGKKRKKVGKYKKGIYVYGNNGIGKNNRIPWRISNDLKHFKNITTTNSDNTDNILNNDTSGFNDLKILPKNIISAIKKSL